MTDVGELAISSGGALPIQTEAFPQLCEACPIAPEGTRAEVVTVRGLTEDEEQAYRESNAAHMDAAVDGFLQDACRVVLRITASNNTNYLIGDSFGFNRRKYGQTNEQVMERFTACHEPIINGGRFAEWVGRTSVCGGQNLLPKRKSFVKIFREYIASLDSSLNK